MAGLIPLLYGWYQYMSWEVCASGGVCHGWLALTCTLAAAESHSSSCLCTPICALSPSPPAAKAAVPADDEDDERGAGGLSLQQQQASEAHGGGGGASRWASAADEEDAAAEKEEAERARQVRKSVLSELSA